MKATCLFLLCAASAISAQAEVKMPAIFGDHMVLQQEQKLPVWGTADPGEKVTVTAGDHTATTTADDKGKWRVDLASFAANAAPITVTVAGKNTLKFEDVLIGEVWLASGQSNMELPLGGLPVAAETEAHAADPQLRLFLVTKNSSTDELSDVGGKWELADANSVQPFSAIGYFFGRELRAKLNRPVGVIGSYWGGTPASAWISLSGLGKAPPFQSYVDQHTWVLDYISHYSEKLAAYQKDLAAWKEKDKGAWDAKLAQWSADAEKAKAANQPEPQKPEPPADMPKEPPDESKDFHLSAALYDGMIAPLVPYGIKGVIWYQGENNTGNPIEYRTLFPRLITDWREKWGEGDFPFLFVQLAGLAAGGHYDAYDKPTGDPGFPFSRDADWPLLREAQTMALTLPKTAVATAIDVGDVGGIHPADKLDVGLRLALAARHVAYGEDIVFSGPVFDKMAVEGNAIRVSFKQMGGGLVIADGPITLGGCLPTPTNELLGFVIAGADRKYALAKAHIDGATVVVSSPDVANPVAVRYDWANLTQANLYNKEGLPALPFRTDDWDTVISPAMPPVQAH